MSSLRPISRAAVRAASSKTLLRPLVRLYSSKPDPSTIPNHELDVGELQGAKFKIEPLRRVGEDPSVMRARLLCQFSSPSLPLQARTHTYILTQFLFQKHKPILIPHFFGGKTNQQKHLQTNPENEEPWNPTCSSQPSPPPTSAR